MLRNVCLILTLIAIAASAFATPATRAHRRTPALAATHKPARAAAKARPAKAASSRKAASSKAASARATQGKAGRAANRASLRSTKQPAHSASSRAMSRTASRNTGRMSPREKRELARRRLVPAVRHCRHCTPEPRVATVSLRTRRPLPAIEPAPEPELKSQPISEAKTDILALRATTKSSAKPEKIGAMPAPLRGSLESLQRQNERTDQDGLERILDEEDLAQRIQLKALVPVPASSALGINENLAESHRYCRPWTARFLTDLSKAYAARFQEPLQVTSAVRTVEYQKQLMHVNGNATAAEGDVVSPHLTGATIDIGKNGMSRQEIAWMRNKLMALQLEGKLDVEEEFRQPCFHITVYKAYSQAPAQPGRKAAGTQEARTQAVQAPSK